MFWGIVALAAKELLSQEALSLVSNADHREKRVAQVSGVLTTLNTVFRRKKPVEAEVVDPRAAMAELLASVPTKEEMRDALTVLEQGMARRLALLTQLVAGVLLLQTVAIVILLVR
jgi:hypothetical protein